MAEKEKTWDGVVRCAECGHEHVARIPIPQGQSVPCVHLECTRCHKMACSPKVKQ